MLRAAATLRDEGYGIMRAALGDPRYTDLLLRLELALTDGSWGAPVEAGGALLDHPVTEFARTILDKRYKRLRRIGGKRADLPEEELHQLRIAGKKVRYVADFFSRPLSEETDREVHRGPGGGAGTSWARSTTPSSAGSCCWGSRGALRTPTISRRPATPAAWCWDGRRPASTADLADFQTTWRQLRDRPPFWTDAVR